MNCGTVIIGAALLASSINARSALVEIKFSTGAILYTGADAKMGLAYANPGDTARFTWLDGAYNIQPVGVPSGATFPTFTLDASNPQQDVIISAVGYYNFTYNSDPGRIICNDPNAPLRYFEFFPNIPKHFVAGTSDPVVLADVDAQLAMPLIDRLWHIKGLLGHTNDGRNYDWSWHIRKNKWRMESYSEESCDGLPQYVEDHLHDFVDLEMYFCPWGGAVIREVWPAGIVSEGSGIDLLIYPNPANDKLYIRGLNGTAQQVWLVDMAGKKLIVPYADDTVNVSNIPSGIYTLIVQTSTSIGRALVTIK